MKNYNPGWEMASHTVLATLQIDDMIAEVTYQVDGNCKGISILNGADELIFEQLNEIQFPDADDYEPVLIKFTKTDGSGHTEEYEIDCSDDLADMIVKLEIIDYQVKE